MLSAAVPFGRDKHGVFEGSIDHICLEPENGSPLVAEHVFVSQHAIAEIGLRLFKDDFQVIRCHLWVDCGAHLLSGSHVATTKQVLVIETLKHQLRWLADRIRRRISHVAGGRLTGVLELDLDDKSALLYLEGRSSHQDIGTKLSFGRLSVLNKRQDQKWKRRDRYDCSGQRCASIEPISPAIIVLARAQVPECEVGLTNQEPNDYGRREPPANNSCFRQSEPHATQATTRLSDHSRSPKC